MFYWSMRPTQASPTTILADWGKGIQGLFDEWTVAEWSRAARCERHAVTFCVQGVVSPLLANIYLHYVYDLWAHQWRQRHARGDMVIVRYADDLVVGFQHRDDAMRFMADLRVRLKAFALSLHPGKTRLVEFGRFAARDRQRRGLGKPEPAYP